MPPKEAVFLFSGELIQQMTQQSHHWAHVSDRNPGRLKLYNLIPQSNASNVGNLLAREDKSDIK